MISGDGRLVTRFVISGILFITILICFIQGIVVIQTVCPDKCVGVVCPKTCESIWSNYRTIIPFGIITFLEFFTLLFIIGGFKVLCQNIDYYPHGDDLYNDCSYDKDCLEFHSWAALILFILVFTMQVCILLGFWVANAHYNYSVLCWLLISKCGIAGGSICFVWFPFCYVKSPFIFHEEV